MYRQNVENFPGRNSSDRRLHPRYTSGRECNMHIGDETIHAALRNVSAAGAFVETATPIDLDTLLVLDHPEAGQIRAKVIRTAVDGVVLGFTLGDQAATFALSAISSDMTRRTPQSAQNV